MSDKLFFIAPFLNIHLSGVLTALAWLVPHESAAISAQVLCTPYNHAPCHFMQSHIRKVYACLSVTCHLHFWQNDRDLLRATAVTRGWNGYRNYRQSETVTLLQFFLKVNGIMLMTHCFRDDDDDDDYHDYGVSNIYFHHHHHLSSSISPSSSPLSS